MPGQSASRLCVESGEGGRALLVRRERLCQKNKGLRGCGSIDNQSSPVNVHDCVLARLCQRGSEEIPLAVHHLRSSRGRWASVPAALSERERGEQGASLTVGGAKEGEPARLDAGFAAHGFRGHRREGFSAAGSGGGVRSGSGARGASSPI